MRDSEEGNVYCPQCDLDCHSQVKEMTEVYSVRGEDISVNATVRICDKCNNPVFDEVLDSQIIEQAYEIYRGKHDYMSAEEIREVRERYGLSQRGMAHLLSWSPATVARYETGALPDPSHMATLRIMRNNPEYIKDLYQANQTKLGRLDQRRLEESLSSVLMPSCPHLAELLNQQYQGLDSTLKGFTQFNFEKLCNMVLYFAKKNPSLSKTKLMKYLFYTDFQNYKEHGYSISGLPYQKLPFGPVPHHHWLLLNALVESQVISLLPFEEFEGEYVEPNGDCDLESFNQEELLTMEKVLTAFRDYSAKQLSHYSYQEEAYIKPTDSDLIPYTLGDSLREFGGN